MNIHVVQQGDTIESIAQMYGVSAERIIENNDFEYPYNLVVGQTVVILIPEIVHTIKEGETLYSIAVEYGTTVIKILQNNPGIQNIYSLAPGREIVIKYEDNPIRYMAVNGYAYPYIDIETLKRTLPYLTFLTVFTYGFTPEGNLIDIDDTDIIKIVRDYGVAPLMLISTLTEEGGFSNELASQIFNNEEAQNNLINNILINLREKNYFGLDVDFEYIFASDREKYVDFIYNLTAKLNAEGYPVIVALAPKISSEQPGLLYEGHDYSGLGNAANAVLLMTYEWGYTYGPSLVL